MIRFFCFFSLCFFLVFKTTAKAEHPYPSQLSFLTGNIGVSYAESESTLVSTDGTPTTTGQSYSNSATALPIALSYEYFSTQKRSYFISGIAPLMASTPDRIFSINGGVNFYFNKTGTIVHFSNDQLTFFSAPTFRYYAGANAGTTYLIYNTLSKKKSDIVFDLGGQAGAIYTYNPQWGIKGELGFDRGIGALVSTTTIKILIGATYTFPL